MLKIVKKAEMPASRMLLQRIGSVLLALLVAGLFVGIWGYNPITIYSEMLKGSLFSVYCLQQTVVKTIPLLIMGLGVAVCFKMKFINIGAEGQFYMGAVAATYVALHHGALPFYLALPLMFLAAFTAGGLWCLIAGLLKARLGVSETLVTLMLNYIAVKIVSYLQYNAWKDPNAYGFPKIPNYPKELQLPQIFGVQSGWILALVLTGLVFFLLKRMKLGYEIAVLGENETTARYAGIDTKKVLFLAVMIGGGLCGLAGVIQAAGVEHTLNDQISGGLGFTAVVIAYLAKMEPVSILFVSFFFAVLLQGGAYIQTALQIPAAAADVIQGVILLFILGSEFFTQYRIVREKKTEEVQG